VGLPEYHQAFLSQDVDGSALLELEERNLKEDLGIGSLGHRLALLRKIRALRSGYLLHYNNTMVKGGDEGGRRGADIPTQGMEEQAAAGPRSTDEPRDEGRTATIKEHMRYLVALMKEEPDVDRRHAICENLLALSRPPRNDDTAWVRHTREFAGRVLSDLPFNFSDWPVTAELPEPAVDDEDARVEKDGTTKEAVDEENRTDDASSAELQEEVRTQMLALKRLSTRANSVVAETGECPAEEDDTTKSVDAATEKDENRLAEEDETTKSVDAALAEDENRHAADRGTQQEGSGPGVMQEDEAPNGTTSPITSTSNAKGGPADEDDGIENATAVTKKEEEENPHIGEADPAGEGKSAQQRRNDARAQQRRRTQKEAGKQRKQEHLGSRVAVHWRSRTAWFHLLREDLWGSTHPRIQYLRRERTLPAAWLR
jgi:hypothetical protein